MAKIELVVKIRKQQYRPKYGRNQDQRADFIQFTNDALVDESEFEDTVKWAQDHLKRLLEEARDYEIEMRNRRR